LLHLLQQHAVA